MNETAQQYIQRITAHVRGKQPLTVQVATAKKLERLIKGVPTSKLREQWKHYGMHSERGQETIEHIVSMTAGHDINHLQQIERILPAKQK